MWPVLKWCSRKPEVTTAAVASHQIAPLCIDCKWYRKNGSLPPEHGKCAASVDPEWSLVAPLAMDSVLDMKHCANMRTVSFECGPSGKLFEARPAPPPVKEDSLEMRELRCLRDSVWALRQQLAVSNSVILDAITATSQKPKTGKRSR